MFDKVVERFLRLSPVTVLSRLAVQRALDPTWLDQVFHQHRDRTYQKDLLFSSVIEVASHVVLGLQPSLHAAYQQASLDVSFQALYGKVGRTEPSVLRAMVRGSYERLAPVVENWAVRARRLVPGHRVRIFDGNDLPASEKRLALLRGFRGAALPGQSLVVYDPDLDLVVDALPWADAHDHERTLMKEMMAEVQPGDINVADRADESTEDGKEVVRILTNVPKRLLDAKRVAEIYRKRWSIEGLFLRSAPPWCRSMH
jgi:IS4 transposase